MKNLQSHTLVDVLLNFTERSYISTSQLPVLQLLVLHNFVVLFADCERHVADEPAFQLKVIIFKQQSHLSLFPNTVLMTLEFFRCLAETSRRLGSRMLIRST